MICVKDENQVALFDTPFENELDKNNPWIKFSKIIPWDKVSSYYNQRMCKKYSAAITDVRILLGALIIKHYENLSDVGTIEAIQ